MMQETRQPAKPAWYRLSRALDGVVGVVSPGAAVRRQQYRMAYDVLDGHRTRSSRHRPSGTGDRLLTESRATDLRNDLRQYCRNNSIVDGMLQTERDDVVGPQGPAIESRAAGGWAAAAERGWKATMLEAACDHTNRFNWPQFIRTAYMSYRRDGDFFAVYGADAIEWAEGEQCGTPLGRQGDHYKIANGVAFKKSGRLLGYYLGTPNKWGTIEASSWRAVPAGQVFHMFNPKRFSQSRGEPALTSALKWIDMMDGYFEAEMVAARVAACFSVFVTRNDETGGLLPDPFGANGSASGYDRDTGYLQEKIEPGVINYLETGEAVNSVGMNRPGDQFDPFVKFMMSLAGRAINMPLMLISGDYSHATFMNARIALQQVQATWMAEQDDILKPFVRRTWRWWVDKEIAAGRLADHPDKYDIEIYCHRWPYVDPVKEEKANEMALANRTTNRKIIVSAKGMDPAQVETDRQAEEAVIAASPEKIAAAQAASKTEAS